MRTLMLLMLLAALASLVQPRWDAPVHVGAAPKRTFDITVSTEWQPGQDDRLPDDLAAAGCVVEGGDSFLADLEAGLRQFASFFYRATGGQFAIGQVTIFTGGEAWDQAQIRVLANRSYRPSAFVGGGVLTPTAYYTSTASLTPATLFYPAPVLLSRLWNGYGGRCGPWSSPEGWRTIAHEWAHHVLYLYDEYEDQVSGAARYCDADAPNFRLLDRGARAPADTGSSIPSLMAYHYTADQFSLWSGAPPRQCRTTPQTTVYDASSWETIARHYASDGVSAPAALVPGPTDAPAITVTIVPPATMHLHTTAKVRLDALAEAGLVGQAYLIRPNPAAAGAPLRIVGQGNILPGETTPHLFWGVQTDTHDRAAVLIQSLRTGARFAFPQDYRLDTSLSTTAANRIAAQPSVWQPRMRIIPIVQQNPGEQFSTVVGLQIIVIDCAPQQLSAVEFVYCPAGGTCSDPVPAAPEPDGSFTHTFFFTLGSSPAPYGYVYARAPALGAETLTWYQLGGGVGPAHLPGHAPIAEGMLNVDMPQNDPRSPTNDNRVLLTPAHVCIGANALPPDVLGTVGQPYTIQIAIAGANVSEPWAGAHPSLRIRLNYDQDLLDRLGIDEHQLVMLRLKGGFWQIVPTVGQSTALDWIGATPLSFAPEGETYTLGYVPLRVFVPLLRR